MERKILVAEDSATQAERLQLLLETAGYRVDVVTNGREGLDRVRSATPDLIISDVVMPEVDGYEFCRSVKSDPRTRRIPFVLLTERSEPADVITGLERGADNFITKPFEDEYLLERVRRIFEHLELRRRGHLDIEVVLTVGERQITITPDKQQMIELLFSTLEELVRANGRLKAAQRTVEEHARTLEAKVEERTQQLVQTEKIAVMGELLAGVAHELNNPIAVLLGHAKLLERTPADPAVRDRVAKIAHAAERCSRIVRNFLALARQRAPERRPVHLNVAVTQALDLVAYPLRLDGVEVTLDLAPDLPVLSADTHQLQQVLVNLATNAHHAMRETPGPRRLSVATRADRERGIVVLEVADSGPGIPPEIQQRIFEPFFTTKPPGQGTGLGLSICRAMIEAHGGAIAVASQPGHGAVFQVQVPIEGPPLIASAEPAEQATPHEPRLILVVDDEADVAEVLGDMLRNDGHTVAFAANGAIALDMVSTRAYDLVLCDVRMPELDGPGLYRELERRAPELRRRLVFITGDTLTVETREFLERTGVPSLEKPFDFTEVRRAVQRAGGSGSIGRGARRD
ncbi:MAG: response regulator [Candidatus Rokubacteria bacterium]|nr:response regulator [Candidatus Rokubacteria bacterium]